jgi:hypothetical protein
MPEGLDIGRRGTYFKSFCASSCFSHFFRHFPGWGWGVGVCVCVCVGGGGGGPHSQSRWAKGQPVQGPWASKAGQGTWGRERKVERSQCSDIIPNQGPRWLLEGGRRMAHGTRHTHKLSRLAGGGRGRPAGGKGLPRAKSQAPGHWWLFDVRPGPWAMGASGRMGIAHIGTGLYMDETTADQPQWPPHAPDHDTTYERYVRVC